jgi:hypothetical protein
LEQTLYVVQPFSQDESGALTWDAPAWSRDRSFAVTLTHSLSKRKAGVVAVGVRFDSSGQPSPEAEVLGSYGRVPSALFLGSLEGCPVRALSPVRAVPDARRSA